MPARELAGLLESTSRFWRSWLNRSTYTGRWRKVVSRSAMTLKLMTFAPTGAPVAAPTAGLPEQAGNGSGPLTLTGKSYHRSSGIAITLIGVAHRGPVPKLARPRAPGAGQPAGQGQLPAAPVCAAR